MLRVCCYAPRVAVGLQQLALQLLQLALQDFQGLGLGFMDQTLSLALTGQQVTHKLLYILWHVDMKYSNSLCSRTRQNSQMGADTIMLV